MENVANKIDGSSTLPAAEFNSHKNELQDLVTESGQTLALATPDQLRKAVSVFARSLYVKDSSVTPNVLTLARPNALKDVPAYFNGMTVVFSTPNANTGATTITINGLATKKVRTPSDADIGSGVIRANNNYTLVYDSTFNSGDGAFIIFAGFAPLDSPAFTGTPTAPVPTVLNQLITMGNIVEKTGAVIGYGTGSGGTVTQATDKATSVTLNKPIGTITMNNAALAAGASVTFTVNNSIADISSVIIVNTNQTIVGAYSNYSVQNVCAGNGNFIVNVKNISAGSLSEALQLNFAVIKGVTA